VRSEHLVQLLDGYFGTREVRGDDWSDLFELVYPEVAHALECAISSELEECARGLLDLAESSLSGSWPPFPREAVETVRRRLGWTG